MTDDSTVIANAQNEDEDRLKAIFKKLVKVDEIVPRDSYAFVDKPVRMRTDNLILSLNKWRTSKYQYCLYTSRSDRYYSRCEPLTLGYEANKVASYDSGRLKLTQRANPETHSIYIESEAAQMCVPRMPQYMFISTVTV